MASLGSATRPSGGIGNKQLCMLPGEVAGSPGLRMSVTPTRPWRALSFEGGQVAMSRAVVMPYSAIIHSSCSVSRCTCASIKPGMRTPPPPLMASLAPSASSPIIPPSITTVRVVA
jgi:hypothetical protein